jgi:hypothetical protein
MRNAHESLLRNPKGRDHMGGVSLNGRNILKGTLKK